jgi:sugar/nucleoside kinase (ribokinase family)
MSERASSTGERRLFLVGNIPVDLIQHVERLPREGEDLRAEGRQVLAAGGGFHVLHAAWRSGLRGRFAGAHGTGPLGDRVRDALAGIECDVIRPAEPGSDTAVVLALVTPSGERTFVSPVHSVPAFTSSLLESLRPAPADLVYVSGYSLGLGSASAPLAEWVEALPRQLPVFCDLGPWAALASDAVLDPVVGRVDWLACNAREAQIITGEGDPGTAISALQRRSGSAGVLVRVGRDGCWLAKPAVPPTLIGVPAGATVGEPPVDTTGAGDAHSGAFLAALARGRSPRMAVEHANGVAQRVVTSAAGTPRWSGFGSDLTGED